MPAVVSIGKTAQEGVTVGDLIQFIQECDRAGIDPRTEVLVRVGFRAQIKRITAGGARP